MHPDAAKIIAGLHGEEALSAFEAYQERIAVCFYDGVMRIEECEAVALSDLRAFVARRVPDSLFGE